MPRSQLEFLHSVKTLLSLAKLALLASDESEEDDTIQLLEGMCSILVRMQTKIWHVFASKNVHGPQL